MLFVLFTIPAYSTQNADTGQWINVKQGSTTLLKVFNSIKEQTGLTIFYPNDLLNDAEKVTLSGGKLKLEDLLQEVLKGKSLTWSVKNKFIVLSKPSTIPKYPIQTDTTITVTGRVRAASTQNGLPDLPGLPGVTVLVKGTAKGTVTDANGRFTLQGVDANATLSFRSLGYEFQDVKLAGRTELTVSLKEDATKINEVTVVSTGYENVSKERITGSVVQLDNELVNRRVSTDALSRLEGITPGLLFNRNSYRASTGQLDINIRGRSTLFANDQPLVVVDNVPYDGDFNNINPNDIESITVLKDAAAASIWGVKAGNGVIVITTKRGRFNQKMAVEVNSNITVTNRPDIFYKPDFINANDFIDLETELFNRNYYNADFTNLQRPPVSPVVEILWKQRSGQLTAAEAEAQINSYRSIDMRNDLEKYFYRNSVNQQYAVNLRGGGNNNTYFLSLGHDRNLRSETGNAYNRTTLNLANNFYPVKNLEVSTVVNYIQSKTTNNSPVNDIFTGGSGTNYKSSIYPYARLVGENEEAVSIVKGYRYDYIDTAGGGRLLDWTYRPLDELHNANNTTRLNDARINLGIKYTLPLGISAEVRYQYQKQNIEGKNLRNQKTYYTRDIINTYTRLNGNTIIRPVPLGDILDISNSILQSNRLRGQLNFNRTFNHNHNITALAGAEINEIVVDRYSNRLYGYNDDLATHSPNINFDSLYTTFINPGSRLRIGNPESIGQTTDRYISYFGNGSYTYLDKYTLTASARIDKSNLFGVRTNQRAVPLYSVGASWSIYQEGFYNVDWLPYLKIRASYGYNGNIDKSVTAYTTARAISTTADGLPYSSIINPPNFDLRWERVRIINTGIDFSLIKNVVSGSIDIYNKKGLDLIGERMIEPSSGLTVYKENSANTDAKGIDLVLNSWNIVGVLKWNTNFMLSYISEKVLRYNRESSASNYIANGSGSNAAILPLEGKPVFSVYSYRWGGLDESGNPQGYINGEKSTDYLNILRGTTIDNMVFNGSARPNVFGSLRNNLSYKSFTLSFNLIYKFNYYFRASSINYSFLYSGWGMHSDYNYRWKNPGDEQITNVPSLQYPPANNNRETLYSQSEILVEKGDHIRLQDITLSYDFINKNIGKESFFRNLQLYSYINNIGIIWKSTKRDIDPDVFGINIPTPRSIALGCKANF